MPPTDKHRWQSWKNWGGIRGEGQRKFCQHCGMVRTSVDSGRRIGYKAVPSIRYERGAFKQIDGNTPPCVGIFLPFKIDGFTITKGETPEGAVAVPLEFQSTEAV